MEHRLLTEVKPRAIIQVSPAVQPNGVFVNYGDANMYWAAKDQLEKRGFSVMALPREKVDCDQLKAQAAELFIDCAGFAYSILHKSSFRSTQAAEITAHNAGCCREAGATAVTAPQTFGPFAGGSNNELNLHVRNMADQMNFIYARDSLSGEHLGRVYPKVSSKVRIAPDLAFLYQPNSLQAGVRLLSRRGLAVARGARPIVGLTLNRQLYCRVPSYIDMMKTVIDFFKAKKTQIVLIPHEQGRGGQGERDDQFLSNALATQTAIPTLSKKRRLSRNAELQYINAVDGAIGAVDFLVSCRFHAAVRALSENVPSVAFSWAHKFERLFQTVQMSGHDNVVTPEDIAAGEAVDIIYAKLEKAWAMREATRHHLVNTIPVVRRQVAEFLDAAVAGAEVPEGRKEIRVKS